MTNGKLLLIIDLVKKLLIVIQSILIYPFLAFPAFADETAINPCTASAGGNTGVIKNILCQLGGPRAGITIGNIIVAIVIIAVIIALVFLLIGAIKWITSGGDKEKVEAARNQLVAAIVGLVVIFLALFLLTIILALFGLSVGNLVIPDITK